MIFVNTRRFSPVVYERDVPHKNDYFHIPPDQVDDDVVGRSIVDSAWWAKQEDRCRNGYYVENAVAREGDALVDDIDAIWTGNDCYLPEYDVRIINGRVWISGRMYFYLNFWPIYGLKLGAAYKDIINPKFLMMDFLFFLRFEQAYKMALDDFELKARQLGFSEKIGGGILGYNYTFIRASVNIVVAGVADDSEHMFENVVRGLDYLKNTQFYKIRSINKLSELYIRAKRFRSEIRALTAKDNPQAVSRFTPTVIVYEEIGKWKKGLLKQTKKFVDISLKTETYKTGMSVYIGTGGDMDAGAADLERMAYNPIAHDIIPFTNKWMENEVGALVKVGHFTPKWMYKIVDNDGNPQKEASIKLIKEQIAKAEPEDRITETSQQACYINEAFLIPGGGFFGEEIVNNLNAQKTEINSHKGLRNMVKRYRLSWKDINNWFKGVDYKIDDEKGWCSILELPERDENKAVFRNLYGAATDSYDFDEALTSSSKGSVWIYKRFLNADRVYRTWVAGYVERPTTAEGGADLFYERTLMVCVMYNALNLIEWSKIRIFDFFKTHGAHSFLKERPQFVLARLIKESKQVNEYGIDPATKSDWLKLLRDYLADPENIKKVYFVELLEAWASFKYDPSGRKYNCDITISTSLNLVLEKDEMLISVQSTEVRTKRRLTPVYESNSDGDIVMVL